MSAPPGTAGPIALLGPLSPPGMLVGLVAGAGLCLVLAGAPAWRRTSLADRLAPHLRDVPRPSSLLRPGPWTRTARGGAGAQWAMVAALLAPRLTEGSRLRRLLERLSGGGPATVRRLRQAGSAASLEQFRAEQVLCGAGGLVLGLVVAAVLVLTRGAPAVPLLVLVVVAGVGGVVARDWWLGVAVAARAQRIVAEFPTVAELLALSVAAGEGAVGALERVAASASGELAAELRATLAHARAGAPLVDALEGLAARTAVPTLGRFVDGLAIALERGTPLAEVLRAQAQDVREASRRQLVEAGGKKEIQMMVPVVFLVLPVTVLFAVFPGASVLSGGL